MGATLAAIGGLVLLVGLAVWMAISEAKTGATQKAAAESMREVIDATKRFNKARNDSKSLPRGERIKRMLQELRQSDS
jgi:hypothetical protein